MNKPCIKVKISDHNWRNIPAQEQQRAAWHGGVDMGVEVSQYSCSWPALRLVHEEGPGLVHGSPQTWGQQLAVGRISLGVRHQALSNNDGKCTLSILRHFNVGKTHYSYGVPYSPFSAYQKESCPSRFATWSPGLETALAERQRSDCGRGLLPTKW